MHFYFTVKNGIFIKIIITDCTKNSGDPKRKTSYYSYSYSSVAQQPAYGPLPFSSLPPDVPIFC
jgi:hypothetical protein